MLQITGSCPDTLATRFANEHLQRYLWSLMDAKGVADCIESVWFHRLPDFSPSLNETRLAVGLPVGGLLGWSGIGDFVPPGVPANGCGMAVARVPSSANMRTVLEALEGIASRPLFLEGHEIQWDAGRKNHFLSVYTDSFGVQYAILHCSFPEGKLAEGEFFHSVTPGDEARREPLLGQEAERFRVRALKIQSLGIEKRRLLLNAIFGDIDMVSNRNHVGFVDSQTLAIGCYAATSPMHGSPLTVAPHQKAFLVSTEEPTELLGGQLYIQPHGTGNSSSFAGPISYSPHSGLFECVDPPLLTDSAQDVFDTHAEIEGSRPWLKPWLDQGATELYLNYEIILRKGFPARNHG